MALTFIHTSDWHLGFLYRRLGTLAQDSYQWRFDAVTHLFDVAIRENAQFILVAGDVFHSSSPTSQVQLQAVQLLRNTPCHIYLIPGNHDPDAPGGVWQNSAFFSALAGHEKVHLLTDPKSLLIADDQVELFPCPLQQADATTDPTAWIPEAPVEQRAFRIGLAHGQWQGYSGSMAMNATHAIDPARSDISALDYLALGDYHSYTPPDHAAAACRTYYSGSPEVPARDEPRSGHALLVKIEQPGMAPTVTPHSVGTLQLCHWGEIALRPGQVRQELEERTASIVNPQKSLISGNLKGFLPQDEFGWLQQWQNKLVAKVAGVELDTKALHVQPSAQDFEMLKMGVAEREILERLNEPLAKDDFPAALNGEMMQLWSADSAVRREAQTLFYQLLSESKS